MDTKKTKKSKSEPAALNFKTAWSYQPALESAEAARIAKRYELFIDGKFVAPAKGQYFPTINPATEAKLSEVAQATDADVDRAVGAARAAYEGTWTKLPAKERGKYLYRIARMLQERAREFIVAETLDVGKPIRESRTIDIPLAANHFFYYAGWADKLEYAFPARRARPVGVVAQVIPWNFPLLTAARKIAPALAAGNTVVLKPAETTPLTALKLAELFQEAGLPPGVVNILTGGSDTGAALVAHPGIDAVAFAGSTEAGRLVQKAVAGTRKKLALELGGKSAQIIFEDAAIDQAVEGVVDGIFFNQGHVRCAGSRLLVQESAAKTVLRKLRDRLETLNVGDPLDRNTDIGAIHSRVRLEKIESYVKAGVAEGATYYAPECALPKKGFFHGPVLFSDVAQSHRITQEEVFGPVLAIQTFRTIEEALEKANNTPYGLAGGVWTDKGSKVFNVTSQLRAGVVWANTYNKFDPTSPFGGYKESGLGREGGLHGLAPYVELG